MASMAGSSVLLPALCVHISISPSALLPPPPRLDEQLMRVRGRATIAATTPARLSAVEITGTLDPTTPTGRRLQEREASGKGAGRDAHVAHRTACRSGGSLLVFASGEER